MLVPVIEPQSLRKTCSLLRREFGDWFSSKCRLYLEQIESKKGTMRPSLQITAFYPELCELTISFWMTDDPLTIVQDLQGLPKLRSLRVRLCLNSKQWRSIGLQSWLRNDFFHDDNSRLLSSALTRIVNQLDRVLEFNIETEDLLTAKYFGTERLQKCLKEMLVSRKKEKIHR